jgi:hypothetical protein
VPRADDPRIEARLDKAWFWQKDEVARQIVAELAAAGKLETLSLADENRLAKALGAGVFSGLVMEAEDRAALRRLYEHPTEDQAFYASEAGHMQAIKTAVLNNPSRSATREQWPELSITAKTAYLRSISDAVCKAYGLEPVPVHTFDEAPEGDFIRLGYARGQAIYLNVNENAMKDHNLSVMVLVHELTHVYQGEIQGSFLLDSIKAATGLGSIPDAQRRMPSIESFYRNKHSYVDSDTDLTAYQNQPIEVHAQWAAAQVGEAIVSRTVSGGLAERLPALVSVPVRVGGRTYRGVGIRVRQ